MDKEINDLNKSDNISMVLSQQSKELMLIKSNGEVFARLDGGELKKVECDKDLGLAFTMVVNDIAKLPPDKLIENIREGYIEKQRVKEALESLQNIIGRQGTNIAFWDLIEEKKRSLGLD